MSKNYSYRPHFSIAKLLTLLAYKVKNIEMKEALVKKIKRLKSRGQSIKLGRLSFDNPLFLAPMSAITHAPFRLLMQELGAGARISELISCYGINYGSQKTLEMLRLDPREENVGIQLFGEDEVAMAKAAELAQSKGASFIDINMGCPVKKVVKKGAGSALLKDTKNLVSFFSTIKKAIDIPLTIKIRTGWDEGNINANQVAKIAFEQGVELVAIHGRTRCQQYRGDANWSLLEDIAKKSLLPIVGNGDLHSPTIARKRLEATNCSALMIGRGALHFPFIFLETFLNQDEENPFGGEDYFEVLKQYLTYLQDYYSSQSFVFLQLKRMACYFAYGLPGASNLRKVIFDSENIQEVLDLAQDFFTKLSYETLRKKYIEHNVLLRGGHG